MQSKKYNDASFKSWKIEVSFFAVFTENVVFFYYNFRIGRYRTVPTY
jgi:hypothetical protein